MSLNLICNLIRGDGKSSSRINLLQTPSTVTAKVLRAASRGWREQAKLYLAWVQESYPSPLPMREIAGKSNKAYNLQRSKEPAGLDWLVKSERKNIGDAWRIAEDFGGRLSFGME